jgi:hypothetical protein
MRILLAESHRDYANSRRIREGQSTKSHRGRPLKSFSPRNLKHRESVGIRQANARWSWKEALNPIVFAIKDKSLS